MPWEQLQEAPSEARDRQVQGKTLGICSLQFPPLPSLSPLRTVPRASHPADGA